MPDAPLSVGFVSLGCAKNLVDSQVMAGVLIAEGLRLAASPDSADVILVNTCAFIGSAREEAFRHIRDACARKAAGACRAVLVAGCLPQRYRAELLDRLPGVDAFVGVDELDRIGGIVRQLAQGRRGIMAVTERPVRLFEPPVPGLRFTGGPYAYLKIAEGCDHRCAFCAIPGIRGRYRSRPVASLVAEAEQLLAHGARELNLISQDVMAYGRDLGAGPRLADLLRALDRIGGRFWIRLLYGYPTGVTDDLLRVMAEVPRVCAYLDVPIQHSHPDVLKRMGRGATAGAVQSLVDRVRRAVPRAAVRTTCLVGHPGETDEHAGHLEDFVRSAGFDHLGVFVFSPEENTRAFTMAGRPPAAVAEARRDRLMAVQREVVDRRAAGLLGTEAVVLLEAKPQGRGALWRGRSERLAPEVDGDVRVRGVPPRLRPGDFVRVRYTGQSDYDTKAVFEADE